MEKKNTFKLNKLDKQAMKNNGLDPNKYTMTELALAHRLEAEKFTRMEYERFVCWLCNQCQMFTRSFAISEKIVLTKKANLTPEQANDLLKKVRK